MLEQTLPEQKVRWVHWVCWAHSEHWVHWEPQVSLVQPVTPHAAVVVQDLLPLVQVEPWVQREEADPWTEKRAAPEVLTRVAAYLLERSGSCLFPVHQRVAGQGDECWERRQFPEVQEVHQIQKEVEVEQSWVELRQLEVQE